MLHDVSIDVSIDVANSWTLCLIFVSFLSHWLKHLEASWSTDLGLTGSAWGDWSNYTDSPLRASTQDVLFKGGAGTVDGGMGAGSFGGSKSTSSTSATVLASDLGVQAPTGYWDPLGLNAKADAATFNRRRAVEIKHGRVAMYATMGYIVPEYYKFPGALARNMMDYDGSNIDVRCIQHWSNMDHPWSFDVHTPLRAKYVEVRWSNMKWSKVWQCRLDRLPVPFSGSQVHWCSGWSRGYLQSSSLYLRNSYVCHGNLYGFVICDFMTLWHIFLLAYYILWGSHRWYFRYFHIIACPEDFLWFADQSESIWDGWFEVLGWLQILWFIGLIEGSGFFSGKYGLGYMKDATMSGTPGDYGVAHLS